MTVFSEKLKLVFLDTLRRTCNVTLACQACDISSSTAYHHRKEDIIFQERWDEALQEGIDLLEAKAHERAFEGTTEPVFWQGNEVGYVKKYSDALTMFLLKAHRPDKYRERSQVDQNVSGGMQLIVETGVPVKSTPTDDLL
jgi:hypothetical protein